MTRLRLDKRRLELLRIDACLLVALLLMSLSCLMNRRRLKHPVEIDDGTDCPSEHAAERSERDRRKT